jgi:hypothetical protein
MSVNINVNLQGFDAFLLRAKAKELTELNRKKQLQKENLKKSKKKEVVSIKKPVTNKSPLLFINKSTPKRKLDEIAASNSKTINYNKVYWIADYNFNLKGTCSIDIHLFSGDLTKKVIHSTQCLPFPASFPWVRNAAPNYYGYYIRYDSYTDYCLPVSKDACIMIFSVYSESGLETSRTQRRGNRGNVPWPLWEDRYNYLFSLRAKAEYDVKFSTFAYYIDTTTVRRISLPRGVEDAVSLTSWAQRTGTAKGFLEGAVPIPPIFDPIFNPPGDYPFGQVSFGSNSTGRQLSLQPEDKNDIGFYTYNYYEIAGAMASGEYAEFEDNGGLIFSAGEFLTTPGIYTFLRNPSTAKQIDSTLSGPGRQFGANAYKDSEVRSIINYPNMPEGSYYLAYAGDPNDNSSKTLEYNEKERIIKYLPVLPTTPPRDYKDYINFPPDYIDPLSNSAVWKTFPRRKNLAMVPENNLPKRAPISVTNPGGFEFGQYNWNYGSPGISEKAYWDWGDPEYCQQQLLALGFSLSSITPDSSPS